MLSLPGGADAEQSGFDLADFLILLQFGVLKQSDADVTAGRGKIKGNL
ncbi:hypothetical protein [Corynebacterium callunae]|nr:hypothetical protein [Corynebacterium callunae]